jgi:HIV Tat-specific factor 1
MALTFPTDIQEFDGDDRISFSRLDNKFIAVHDDGTEFEFDTDLRKWVPAEEEFPQHEEHDYGQHLSTPALQGGAKKRQLPTQNGSEVSSCVVGSGVQHFSAAAWLQHIRCMRVLTV